MEVNCSQILLIVITVVFNVLIKKYINKYNQYWWSKGLTALHKYIV